MIRCAVIVLMGCAVCMAQVGTEEAYERLRRRQAEREARGEMPTTRPAPRQKEAPGPPPPAAPTPAPAEPTDTGIGIFPVADGLVRVHYLSKLVYLGARTEPYYGFISASYRDSGGVQDSIAGFFRVSGKPEKLDIRTTDERILTIVESPSVGQGFSFLNEGEVIVEIRLASVVAKIPIRVVRLPFSEGDSTDQIVELIGLPDGVKQVTVSWPKTKQVDEITYMPDAAQRVAHAQHWRWKSHPGLVVAIVDGKIRTIRTSPERDIHAWVADEMRWIRGQ